MFNKKIEYGKTYLYHGANSQIFDSSIGSCRSYMKRYESEVADRFKKLKKSVKKSVQQIGVIAEYAKRKIGVVSPKGE